LKQPEDKYNKVQNLHFGLPLRSWVLKMVKENNVFWAIRP